MSQASQKNRNANSLTLNPAKPSAKTKNERTSVDGREINQKAKDLVAKDTKESTKVNNEEKASTKKEKIPVVAEVAKTEKNDEKLKNGSSTNSEDSTNTKISNGSHKIEESGAQTTEEKKTRETRQKTTAVKDNKLESAETVNDTKLEKSEKPAEKPAAAVKEKEKDKDTTKPNQKDKEKDKETTKSNQKDKKQDKEEKPSGVKDTPKKDTKDAKSLRSQTASPKEKDTKVVSQPITDDTAKSKSKPDSTPSKPKKIEEVPEEAPALKDDKPKEIAPVFWDNEEMEPLMMQVDVEEKTPVKESAPTLTSTPTPNSRILRMRSGPSERNASPLSLYTIEDPKNNTSTCVNLSSLTNPHTPDKSYGAKIRSVSGRRPMLRDITYQNSYLEHIRYNEPYSPSAINESTSSGYLDQSQRSVNTSSFIVRKRYNEDHIVEEIESQKRPRLDVTSLLTLVASPVTMLRNRLARARIQSSTPNTTSNINKDDIEIDTVTASCIDEPKGTETEEEEGLQDVFLGNDDADIKQLPKSVDYDTAPDDIEMHTDIQIKILKEENKQSSPFVPKAAIKKKWNCSLM